jgi:hypothetical protein
VPTCTVFASSATNEGNSTTHATVMCDGTTAEQHGTTSHVTLSTSNFTRATCAASRGAAN